MPVKLKSSPKALVYGFGVNDASYQVRPIINGKPKLCLIYSTWCNMLQRCYSGISKTYDDCYVCEEWLLFSNFYKWVKTKKWKGKDLDKDILIQGNKVYSPLSCVFVDSNINRLLINGGASKTGGLKGTTLIKSSGKYRARCSNSNGNKNVHLGCFDTESEAHQAYVEFRYKSIREVAETQEEPIRSALLNYVIA